MALNTFIASVSNNIFVNKRMKHLIITNDLAGAGVLKQLEREAFIICLERRLLIGPMSFKDRNIGKLTPKYISDSQTTLDSNEQKRGKILGDVDIAIEMAKEFDNIELYFDPTPNAQLVLAWLLDRLATCPKLIERTTVVCSDRRFGIMDPFKIKKFPFIKENLRHEQLEDATRIWSAWTSPTPHQIFALLDDLHGSLPYARSCVLSLLDELPSSDSGLGATETSLIKFLRGKSQRLDSFISDYLGGAPIHAFEIQEIIPTIKYLCGCPVPIIETNVGDNKTQEFDLDINSIGQYAACKVTLGSLGHEILDQTADFMSYNPVRRWWGNTKLYGNDVWRWNPREKKLAAPGQ